MLDTLRVVARKRHSSTENFSVKLDGQQCACTSTLEINDMYNLTNVHQRKVLMHSLPTAIVHMIVLTDPIARR